MNRNFAPILFFLFSLATLQLSAQTNSADTSTRSAAKQHLFIDVHRLEPGKVTYAAVAAAHAKDLAVQSKYGVHFLKYWVDQDKGLVYCLSTSSDTASIRKTHAEAHGLLPDDIYVVTDGPEAALNGQTNFFLDVHELGAGKVSAKDVAAAHQKDLAVERKYGVNFINYWVDENKGLVVCLSQARDASSVINTHKEAHGLIPAYVLKVKQGE